MPQGFDLQEIGKLLILESIVYQIKLQSLNMKWKVVGLFQHWGKMGWFSPMPKRFNILIGPICHSAAGHCYIEDTYMYIHQEAVAKQKWY